MGKYIDAEQLKEFLNNKYKEFTEKSKNYCFMQYQFMADGLNIAEQVIDSLQQEQPEVDIRSELEKYIFPISVETMKKEPFTQLEKCAHYFYELGLNARKEE